MGKIREGAQMPELKRLKGCDICGNFFYEEDITVVNENQFCWGCGYSYKKARDENNIVDFVTESFLAEARNSRKKT